MYSKSREKEGDIQLLTGHGPFYVYFKSISKPCVNEYILHYINTHFVLFPCTK